MRNGNFHFDAIPTDGVVGSPEIGAVVNLGSLRVQKNDETFCLFNSCNDCGCHSDCPSDTSWCEFHRCEYNCECERDCRCEDDCGCDPTCSRDCSCFHYGGPG